MSWNHRLVRFSGSEEITLCEVYYDENGKPNGYDPTPFIMGETTAEIEATLAQMAECLKKPILNLGE